MAVWLAGAAAAAGPVQYLSQSRTIGGSLREHYVFSIDGNPADPVDVFNDGSKAAPDFGNWDDSVTVHVVPPPGAEGLGTGESFASQRSSLRDAGISAAGDLAGNTSTNDGAYGVSAGVDVTFALDTPRAYDLTYTVQADFFAHRRTTFTLSALDTGATVFEELPDFSREDELSGRRTGTLAPGRYRFLFTQEAGGDTGTNGPYSFDLALTPSRPTAIPLPPAVWAGLLTTGGFAATGVARRRRRE
jgi:hypothetical protein